MKPAVEEEPRSRCSTVISLLSETFPAIWGFSAKMSGWAQFLMSLCGDHHAAHQGTSQHQVDEAAHTEPQEHKRPSNADSFGALWLTRTWKILARVQALIWIPPSPTISSEVAVRAFHRSKRSQTLSDAVMEQV